MAKKTFVVDDGHITLTVGGISRLLGGSLINYVSIIAEEDASAGQYHIYVTTTKGEAPRKITDDSGADRGIIDATKIGPSTPIGDGQGVQFVSPVKSITVVAEGVVGQTSVVINVEQY